MECHNRRSWQPSRSPASFDQGNTASDGRRRTSAAAVARDSYDDGDEKSKSKWANPPRPETAGRAFELGIPCPNEVSGEYRVRLSESESPESIFIFTPSRLKSIKSFGHVCILRHGGEMGSSRRSSWSVPMNHQQVTARPTRESGGAPDLSSELGIPI